MCRFYCAKCRRRLTEEGGKQKIRKERRSRGEGGREDRRKEKKMIRVDKIR